MPRPNRLDFDSVVARAAGVELEELSTTRFGPKGNPTRLVAAHLLSCRGGLTHREVGRLLGMSDYDVSKALKKVRDRRGSGDALSEIAAYLETIGW